MMLHHFNFVFFVLLSLPFCFGISGSGDVNVDYDYDYYNYDDYDYDQYPEGAFQCKDGVKNISIDSRCDGEPDCLDESDEFASECDACNADHLFLCQGSQEQVCLHVRFKCDGLQHCHDATDELASECSKDPPKNNELGKNTDGCGDPEKFKCRFQGQITCLNREHYQCNGIIECDDWKDEIPSTCNDCERDGLFKCRDGSQCVKKENVCDKKTHCVDGSDESDSFAGCDSCEQDGNVQCPSSS